MGSKFCVLHIQKFQGSALRGMGAHAERGKQEKDDDKLSEHEYVSHTNPDIDSSKTKENVVLIRPQKSLYVAASKRAREIVYGVKQPTVQKQEVDPKENLPEKEDRPLEAVISENQEELDVDFPSDPPKKPKKAVKVVNKDKQAPVKQEVASRASEEKRPRKIRKNAVLAFGVIISSDRETLQELGKERTEEYFKDALKFLQERYGEKNVIAAVIHYDETTPHLHCYIVPECKGKLNAKELITKEELRSIQTDFALEVGQKYGLKRGREGSQAKHISSARWKLQQAEKKVENLNRHLKYYRYKKLAAIKATPVPFTNKVLVDKEEIEKIKESIIQSGILQKDKKVLIAMNKSLEQMNKSLEKTKEKISEKLLQFEKEQNTRREILKEFSPEEIEAFKFEAQKRKEKKREERKQQREKDSELEL